MPALPLQVLAGRVALGHLRREGLSLSDVGVVVATAGGTKFLTVGGLDQALFPALVEARAGRTLHCIGSSTGSLRVACLACADPREALERLADAYIGMRRDSVSRSGLPIASDVLSKMLGSENATATHIVDHPTVRLHLLTSGRIGLAASRSRPLQLAGLGIAYAMKAVSLASLEKRISRAAFHSRAEPFPLDSLADVPTRHETLTADNLRAVLLSSAAEPFSVPGVAFAGGPPGVHRDGTLADHHSVLDLPEDAGLVLYPHFYGQRTPSWFDRPFPGRRAKGNVLDRVVVIAPTEEFIARLPDGRMPSRRDVRKFTDADRALRWRTIWSASKALGDALRELLEDRRRLLAALSPLH